MSRFRKVCRWLHRECGYLIAGLTLAYAVSGVAVNHIDSWNPNYALSVETARIEPVDLGPTDDVVAAVLPQLRLDEPVKQVWRAAPDRLHVLSEHVTIIVDLASGAIERRTRRERPLLWDLNFLHLNHGKGIWTWIADGYAVGLALLALTGVFLVRGRRGLAGRGGLLLAVGVVGPIVYLVYAKYL